MPRARELSSVFGFLPSPPPLPRIVARAQICCALALRLDVEAHRPVEEAQALVDSARDWLAAAGFADELEATERAALDSPVGELAAQQAEAHDSRAETAGVIAWALRLAPLGGFAADHEPTELAGALGFLQQAGIELATGARLRDRGELGQLLEVVSTAHWRLRQRLDSGEAISMRRYAPDAFEWPPEVQPFELAAGDLALAGVPVTELDSRALLATMRRVQERHRAILWVLGQQRRYGDVVLTG